MEPRRDKDAVVKAVSLLAATAMGLAGAASLEIEGPRAEEMPDVCASVSWRYGKILRKLDSDGIGDVSRDGQMAILGVFSCQADTPYRIKVSDGTNQCVTPLVQGRGTQRDCTVRLKEGSNNLELIVEEVNGNDFSATFVIDVERSAEDRDGRDYFVTGSLGKFSRMAKSDEMTSPP